MAKNQNIKDRLFLYIEYKGISARRFSTECGFSANYATNISKGIPEDKMNIISVHFPDLNPSWLMTGEGTMLRVDATASTEEEEIAKKTDMYKSMMEELARIRKENEEKDKMIAKLNERIDMQDNVIKRLLSDSAISKCNG